VSSKDGMFFNILLWDGHNVCLLNDCLPRLASIIDAIVAKIVFPNDLSLEDRYTYRDKYSESMLENPPAWIETAIQRCLAFAQKAKHHSITIKLRKFIAELEDENWTREEILAFLQQNAETFCAPKKLKRWDTYPTRAEELKEVGKHFMSQIQKNLENGSFKPSEWVWCLDPDSDGDCHVLHVAANWASPIRFTPEDIGYIRQHCAPQEISGGWSAIINEKHKRNI
jgi:hypothetical protein